MALKILCKYDSGGSVPVRTGWGRVFNHLGHQFKFWYPEPAFDAFRFEPDVFLGTTYSVDRSVIKNIAARPEMKVALFCSAWGERAVRLKKRYPIDYVADEEKRNIERLKKETGKPDFVFLHCCPSLKDEVIGGWAELGVRTESIMNAADTFAYNGGRFKPEYSCEVGYIGGRWGYKAQNLDKAILPLCSKYKVKIFSRSEWPVANCVGDVSDEEMRHAFASATICLNVSEPHSTDPEGGYDLVERPFKAALSGFCVSDYVEGFNEILGPEVFPMYRGFDELAGLINYYLQHEDKRVESAQKTRNIILRDHTYFNRVSQMFEYLGYPEEAKRCVLPS